jgi:hypothetical protein
MSRVRALRGHGDKQTFRHLGAEKATSRHIGELDLYIGVRSLLIVSPSIEGAIDTRPAGTGSAWPCRSQVEVCYPGHCMRPG